MAMFTVGVSGSVRVSSFSDSVSVLLNAQHYSMLTTPEETTRSIILIGDAL